MRYLPARNPQHSIPVKLVPMRAKYDCLTCVTAMLLDIRYEEVEKAFGGNFDPTKDMGVESRRVYSGLRILLMKYHRGTIEFYEMPQITEGRRYWVQVKIHDPSNPLSEVVSHSIVVDELGKAFDPNPQYGEFSSLKEWRAALTFSHTLKYATEIFEFSP